MKLSVLFAFVATAAAAGAIKAQDDSQGAQSQGAQSQGAQSQGAQSYGAQQSQGAQDQGGYGQQQSYGAQQSYGESYAHESVPLTPKCCVSQCPDEAPFFNAVSCACVPGLVRQEYHEQYAPQQSYGAQQSYGGQQQSGYRQLQQVPEFTSGPEGTVDTRNLRIQRAGRIMLWVTFAIFFILACYYLRMYNYYYTVADAMDGRIDGIVMPDELNNSILHFLANPSLVAGIVCLIASLAYLTMASGNGWYTRCHDGRMFFYARYIDWVVTTPLMLHALAHFSNSPDEIWNFLFFSDIVMIVAGLIASTITGVEKWIYFGFAMLAFIPVLYYICYLRSAAVDNRLFDPRTGLLTLSPFGPDGTFLPYVWFWGTYRVIADLTVAAWFLYPVVWIFAEGTGSLSVSGEAITYAVLDLIAKGVFGWFIVNAEFRDFRTQNFPLVDRIPK